MRFLAALALLSLSSCQTSRPMPEVQAINHDAFQTVSFASTEGTPLQGYLFKPDGKGPFPAIVALHGCAGLFAKNGKMHKRDLDWGRRLSSEGYVVLYPDSFATRGIDEICTKDVRPISPMRARPRDTYGALRWLEAQPYVANDRVALMGWSNGGSTTLWSIDHGYESLAEGIPHDFKTAIAFYPGCATAAKSGHWANRLPLEILIGANDNWCPPKPCQALVDSINGPLKPAITIYPDSFHDFDAPDTPLSTRHDLAYTANDDHTATLGTNEPARQKAIARVHEILASTIGASPKGTTP